MRTMATIYPTYNVASTPSTSSQSSLPPSYAITVHDHVLPPGWQCKFDPKTSKYYFLNDQLSQLTHPWDFKKYGHQSSTHSSRISSPSHTFTSYGKYFQPFTSRYKVSDATPHKLSLQFPHVDENYLNHLMKIYHNRENLVISALLAEGYTRSFNIPSDDTLFYKLKSYFPAVDPDLIRHMLIKHDNIEHEVIAAIISTLGPNNVRYQSTAVCPGSPKMKLRYLKLMYPEADEAVLFDLLYNCDQNAMEAINRLEAMGYKRTDTSRTSNAKIPDLDLSKIGVKAFRPQSAPIRLKTTHFPPNITEKQKMVKTLAEEFPKVSQTLINMALDSSGFNHERARVFLSAMTPQDSSKYFPTDIKSAEMSPLVARYCRGTQTNALLDTVSGTPIKTAKTVGIKVTKGTSTTEDGIFVDEKKKPTARGPDAEHRKGPNFLNLIKSYFPWKGSESKNKNGPNPSNRKGPDSNLKKGSKSQTTAKGPQQSNRKGALGRLIKFKGN